MVESVLPLRFRTFRGRLSFFFLSLVALVLAASFLIVLQANRRYALRQIETNLRTGSRIFATLTDRGDFTPLSERLTPGQLLEVLNAYLTSMSQIVDAHGGVVDKYIGDALMALFGAPLEMPNQASQALATALEMQAALAKLNQRLFRGEGYALRFGIGIHTATVVAGNIGSPERYNYTVIGDGVNVASRLQALTRKPDYDTDIIVSDDTLHESGESFRPRRLGEVPVKGKQQLVAVHALLGRI